MTHTCHAIDCDVETRPEMFMCLKHWRMVPRFLQKLIWKYYRPGQCDDWEVSKEYCLVAKNALIAVRHKEGKGVNFDEEALLLYDFFNPDKQPKASNDGKSL